MPAFATVVRCGEMPFEIVPAGLVELAFVELTGELGRSLDYRFFTPVAQDGLGRPGCGFLQAGSVLGFVFHVALAQGAALREQVDKSCQHDDADAAEHVDAVPSEGCCCHQKKRCDACERFSVCLVAHGVAVFCFEREFRMFGRNSEEGRD